MPDSITTEVNPRTENDASDSSQKDKWTLMFYIAGDAVLSASMISQLKELTDAGFQKDTNVLLYFDPNCNGKGARIYDVNHYRKQNSTKRTRIGDGRNPFVRNIAEDCNIQSLQQIPAALSLRYFLTYSRSYYPAKNYMLFLMGHGVIVGNDQFLPDDDDGSSITLADLGQILKDFAGKVRATDGDEFHLVAFHSCGMSSVELAFELQGSARYMMGTQGSAFPGSWPYRQLLKKIFNAMGEFRGDQAVNTGPYPNPLVKEILRGLQDLSFYNAHDFSDAGFSADLSMCSLDEGNVNRLREALQVLVRELKKGLRNDARDSILLAHWESQSYFGESYTDLFDFCKCLQKHLPQTGPQDGIWRACEKVKDVLQSEGFKAERLKGENPDGAFDQLVVFSDYYGPAYQHSNGLSIFFPWKAPIAKVTRNYENYKFTTQLGSDSWMSFLKDYFFLTKRPKERPIEGADKRPIEGADKPTEEESPDIIALQAPLRAPIEELSDEQLLRIGPPPRQKPLAVAKRFATLQNEMGALAEKLLKKMATLEKETGTLAENNRETSTLAKEIGSLAKEIGSLAETGKETATLAKKMVTLAVKMATLEKETGTLAETGIGGTLEKETGTLAKEIATLSKETGSLAKETGTLVKETGTLSKETGTLSKETGSLAKEMASLGLFVNTIIKNFDDGPEDEPITSRPLGDPNRGRPQAIKKPQENGEARAAGSRR
jgi:disks large protein 1